ncbi:MAG TPA: plastocyanin/azurin family copper-binding protein [Herpetosiphonaceae bacterium]
MRLRWPALGALLLAAGALLWMTPGGVSAQAAQRCFPETGQCVSGRFLEYWEQNGGLAVFGFPVTAAADEINRDTGKPYLTQWFERNRFELHPENARPYDVLLGRLGDDRLLQQSRRWQDLPKGAAKAGCEFYQETGHTLCAPFKEYFSAHGLEFDGQRGFAFAESLALFGYPLSEPAMETNANGDTVLTQWFERARFEFHPNNPKEFQVLLGLLGKEVRGAGPPAAQADIQTFQFKPGRLEVKAGTTVTWTNRDAIEHSVTGGTPPNPAGTFDSGFFTQGESRSFTFDEPGEFAYFCKRHNSMVGTIVVAP